MDWFKIRHQIKSMAHNLKEMNHRIYLESKMDYLREIRYGNKKCKKELNLLMEV